ncbi:MAG: ATP-binding protein [Oscillospiraceae bacterium]|nr:ATP-binding protein [Oscillospiraceae bacterium]
MVVLLVGVLFGEMNDEGIREAGKCIHRYCVIFCGAICLIFFLFARLIAKLYISEDGELLNMTVFAVRMIALQTPINGLVRPRITYLQAVGRTRNMQLLTAMTSLIYVVLSAYVLGAAFGPYGVLARVLLSDSLSLATVWLYYAITKRKPIPTPEDYMALPENFHRSPGDVILLDVRDEEDVSLVSQQIQLFCKGHKIDKQTGYEAAVCFEELAVNTIRHGFPKCKKSPGIDLRVVYDPKELIIRIQDNCPSFNVEREIAMTLSEGAADPGEHLGLKVLGGMASDIKYVHSLETNNVIMHFSTKV